MNGNGRAASQDVIDRVLDGKDADTKARVLEFVYRMNIDATDELFLFCIAIGYLETIVVEAPEQWEAVFTTFRSNLNQWKDNQIRTLETSTAFVEQLTAMTHSLTEQTSYTNDIAKGLMRIHQQLESIEKPSPNFKDIARALSQKIDRSDRQQTRQILTAIEEMTAQMVSRTPAPAPNTNGGYTRPQHQTPYPTNGATPYTPTTPTGMTTTAVSPAVKVLLVVVLLLTGSNSWLLWQQRQVTGWLLYKANRAECRSGIIDASSPLCN